jgi:protein gp37
MAVTTAIEWTNATWNPWRGCTKVSPGCASCYMFRDQERYGRDPSVVVRAAPATFYAPLKWRDPKLVFTCSWSDWFHEDADPWRDEAWDIVRRTPHLTYQILTKRAERIAGNLPADWGDFGYPNVWLGVSVENPRFYWRLEMLGDIPAPVRFLSAEPLLRPLDLTRYIYGNCGLWGGETDGRVLDWVIVGGESGGRPGHPPRQMHPDWVRSLRDQCVRAGVPYFLKQWGGARPGGTAELDGREWREMPAPAAETPA